jgi:hypothetical protein
MSLHRQRVHPEFVVGCFGCHVGTLQLTTPPTNDAQARQHQFQTQFAAEFHNGDREAYRRLRLQGLQPPRIAGSGHLERHAETRFEVESGMVAEDRKHYNDVMKAAADAGIDPSAPATAPKAEASG